MKLKAPNMKLPLGRKIKKVDLHGITLKLNIDNQGDWCMTIHSVTTLDSKTNISELISEDDWEIINWQLEKNINEEVMYEVDDYGRPYKVYGVWKINETFHDNIPDFSITRITNPNTNRNLVKNMDDLTYVHLHRQVYELDNL